MRNQPNPHRNITRYDGPKSRGWRVLFKRRRQERWKWFFDSAYGGREGARLAAVAYWKLMVLKLPVALRVMRRDARNNTGVVGVHLDWTRDGGQKYWSYRASWPDGCGKTVRRGFSVKKYGESRALALAAKARRDGLQRLEAAKRAALRREVGVMPSRSP